MFLLLPADAVAADEDGKDETFWGVVGDQAPIHCDRGGGVCSCLGVNRINFYQF